MALASMLAGPVIKGDQGAAEAKRCTQMMVNYLQVQNNQIIYKEILR